MIGTKRLKEIEAREKEATPRDWSHMVVVPFVVEQIKKDDGLWHAVCECQHDNDLDFIAHARADVPDLCLEVRRLVKALRGWKCTSCNGRGKHHGHGTCLYCNGTGLDERASAALEGYEVDDG